MLQEINLWLSKHLFDINVDQNDVMWGTLGIFPKWVRCSFKAGNYESSLFYFKPQIPCSEICSTAPFL